MANYKNSNSKTGPISAGNSIASVYVHRTSKSKEIPLLSADVVPAGVYRTKITDITDAQCASGIAAADVTYRFTDDTGFSAEAKIRYPINGFHIKQLCEALMDAGLPEGSPLVDGIGIEEVVEVGYPYEGALGKIKSRRPADSPAPSTRKSKGIFASRSRPVIKSTPTPKDIDGEDEEDEDDEDDFIEDDD